MKRIIWIILLIFVLVSCNSNEQLIIEENNNENEVKVVEKNKTNNIVNNDEKDNNNLIKNDDHSNTEIDNNEEYYIKDWKVFLNNWGSEIHITQNISNIWLECYIWDVRNEALKILSYSDKYLAVLINWWICEWGWWNSVYYFNIENLSYINDWIIFKYLEENYWEKTLYQLLWVNWSKLEINVFKYLNEEKLWYRNTIVDDSKTVEKIIEEDNSREFIKTIEIDLDELFLKNRVGIDVNHLSSWYCNWWKLFVDWKNVFEHKKYCVLSYDLEDNNINLSICYWDWWWSWECIFIDMIYNISNNSWIFLNTWWYYSPESTNRYKLDINEKSFLDFKKYFSENYNLEN